MLRIALLVVIFLPLISLSQTINRTIEGIVVNHLFTPIPNATIKIITNDTDGVVKKFAFANTEGKFKILMPTTANTNTLYLQISVVGYTTCNVLITDSLVGKYHTFIIHALTKTLPDVHVVANNGITKRGDTTSFKVSAFAKGNENSVADLMKKLPGFEVDNIGKIKYNGKKIDAVLVEDDDLFGSNYGNLVNNVSINGIEKIEVIENYKNTSKLENTFAEGKQTVVNLKYKKIGLKNFGEAQLGYAPNKDLYEIKLSNTTLSKRVKGITIGNKNQTGFLAQKLFGLDNEQDLPVNQNIEYPENISSIKTPVSFNNIEPKNINSYRVFDNNSSLLSANLLIKPSKKILFKNNYAIVNDIFSQSYSSINTYSDSIIPFIINQQSNILKNNKYFFTEGEASFNWNPKNQTRLYYVLTNGIGNHTNNGFFQLNPLQQQLSNDSKQGNILLTHTTVLNEKSLINFRYVYHNSFSNANYLFNNPIADSIFKITNTDKHINQQIGYNQTINMFAVKWVKELKPFSLTVNYNGVFKNIVSNANAYRIDSNNVSNLVYGNFNNYQNIDITQHTVSINIIKRINKKFSINYNNQFKSVAYSYNFNNKVSIAKQEFYLPNLGINWRVVNGLELRLNAALQAQLPNPEQLNNATVFTGINTVTKGADTVNMRTGYNINTAVICFPNNQQYNFLFFAIYNKLPNTYANNFLGRGLYTIYNLVPFNNDNDNISIFFNFNKNLAAIKSWLKINFNYIYNKSYSSTVGLPTSNTTNLLKSEIRFNTNWNKWFNINTGIVYTTNSQKSLIANVIGNSFSSQDWLTNTTIELKLHEKYFLDIQHDYLINQPYNQHLQYIQFVDTKLRYNINSKWLTTLLLRNILNANKFTTNNASSTLNIVQNFSLTPFFALLTVGYKF